MIHQPTARVLACEDTSIRVMYDMAENSGRDLIRLEVGEPDFDTPAHVIDAATAAARSGQTHYTTNAGLPELRRAIAAMLESDFAVPTKPEDVLVTTGGMEALHLVMLCTVNPGEEVIIPTPGWPNYWMQARLADGVPKPVEMAESTGFDLDADRVIEEMGDQTAAVVLCRPSNPTGQVYSASAVRAVVEAAADYGVYVLADEVYLGLTYDGDQRGIASMVDNADHVLTIGSCSKQYAMTGWRVGWLAGSDAAIDEATKIRESTTACTSSIAQHAAIAALTGPQTSTETMYEAFASRRDYVVDRVAAIDGIECPRPEGAFYAFLDVDLPGTSLEIAKSLFSEYDVVLAPGDGFGAAGAGRLRLSFAAGLDELEAGSDQLARAVE